MGSSCRPSRRNGWKSSERFSAWAVYQIMERIAQDKAKVYGAKNRELKQEVEIHRSTISGFGNPDEELENCRTELAGYESSLQAKIAERDKNKILLTNQQEAAERRTKLLTAITTLQSKKAATGQNRATSAGDYRQLLGYP